jgi:DNA-nicking Smr family endonuclease
MGKDNRKRQTKDQTPLLDLHGFRTEDVPDAVDRFLMASMRRGAGRIRIMTGVGSGAVRKTVINYLSLGGYPYENERLLNGDRNEGVLIVFLDD